MRVLIACDDPARRDAFLDALRQADISAIAAPPRGAATLELARRHRPDVVWLDDELPGLGGVPGLQKLAAETPDSHVVTLAGEYEEGRGVRAVMAGAAGYLSREIAPATLPRVVRAVMRGEVATPRSLTPALIGLARSDMGMRPVRSVLTPREWEVLDLLTSGASTKEITDELVISLETVQSHIKHILRKLGVHSRGEAVARALELRRNRPEFGAEFSARSDSAWGERCP
jgi:DNA-binding NarL/FixJ family response regulator